MGLFTILVQLGSEFGLIMTWSLRLFTRTALLVVSVSGAPTEDTGDETPDTGSQGYQGPPSQYTKPYNSFSAPQSSIVPSWPQAPSQGWQRPSYNTKPYLFQVPKDPRNYMPSQSVSGVEPISSASSDPVIQPAIQPASTLPYPYQASPSYSSPCGSSMSSSPCGGGYNPGYGTGNSGYNPGYGSGNSGYNPSYGSGNSGYNPGTGNGNCYNICGSRQKCGSYGGNYGGSYGEVTEGD